jgi:hypothetical protein
MSAINSRLAPSRTLYAQAPGVAAGPEPVGDVPTDPAGTPALAPGDTPPSGPDIVTFPDGRPYRVTTNPATGHQTYEHVSTQTAANGNVGHLTITIDLAPEGTATKTVKQRIDSPTGAFSDGTTVTSYDAAFSTTGETVDLHTSDTGKELTEHTVSSYTAGQETGRVTDLTQLENQTDATTGEKVTGDTRVHGEWFDGGQPLTDAIVPVIQRNETVTYTTPGQGINSDTDRLLTTTRYSEGPLNALTYPQPMQLTVRFNGHGDQYLERRMDVPLDASGNPQLANAKVTGTTDNQLWWIKGLTTARVWGGLSSQLLAIAGSRLLGGSLGGVGKALMLGGVGVSSLSAVGEGHAVLDKRNDGSWARLAMSLYDTAWLGGVVLMSRKQLNDIDAKIPGTNVSARDAMTGAAALGIAGNAGLLAGTAGGTFDELGNSAQLGQVTLERVGLASGTIDTTPLRRSSILLGALPASTMPTLQMASQLTPLASATRLDWQ